jgi:hypothetical protein
MTVLIAGGGIGGLTLALRGAIAWLITDALFQG